MATVWAGSRVVPSRHPSKGNTVFFRQLIAPEVYSPDCPAGEDGAYTLAENNFGWVNLTHVKICALFGTDRVY